jgi:DNA-directed RNA polymerase specialized sigma24 family protein
VGTGLASEQQVLQLFLETKDSELAQRHLDELLSGYVAPIVEQIVRFKICSVAGSGRGEEPQDEEDIRSEVFLTLISHLRDMRSAGSTQPIENFRGYVAATTYNAVHQYIREKYPVRSRLKNRLRYLFNHRPNLALMKDAQNEFLCSFKDWAGKVKSKSAPSMDALQSIEKFQSSLPAGTGVDRMNSEELCAAYLKWRDGPVFLEDLVAVVAELHGIKDLEQVTSQDPDEETGAASNVCDLLPDPRGNVASDLEARGHLEQLWHEICQLPRDQRVALLLNLRDARSSDALVLFSLTGIATLRQIATVTELPWEEFVELWNNLPLQDIVIAGMLGMTRQQVINLRKSARERLARRMAARAGLRGKEKSQG